MNSDSRELDTIGDAKFSSQRAPVRVDRFDAAVQFFSDLLGRQPVPDQREDVALPFG